MASSKGDKKSPEQENLVKGAAGPDVPKTTRSEGEGAASSESVTQRICELLDLGRLSEAYRIDPGLASKIILRRVTEETTRTGAAMSVAVAVLLLEKQEASQDEINTISDLVDKGDEASLRKAFEIHSAVALYAIATLRSRASEAYEAALASLLRKRVSDSLYLAQALTCIAQDPRDMSAAIDFLLREGAVLTGLGRFLVVRSLGSLDPLVVMPHLVRFLRVVPGDAFQDVLDTIEGQILSFERRGFHPQEAQRCRDVTLSQLAELLNDDRTLGRSVKDAVVGIILRHANELSGGIDVLVGKLADAWRVSVEEAGWRLCGEVLTNPQSREAEWGTAVEWYLGRGHREDRWRVYVAIFERSTEPERRLIAVRRLGSDGPTAAGPPLPGDVTELRNWLLDLSDRAEDQRLRDEAGAALNKNLARGKEEAPKGSISSSLTILPRLGETSPVARMDPQGPSLVLDAKAASPDLDIPSLQIATASANDGFLPMQTEEAAATGVHAASVDLSINAFTTEDPVVQRARALPVRESAEDLLQLGVFEHGRSLLRYVDTPSAQQVQLYLDQLHKTDFSKFSIAEKHEIARAVNRLVEAGELTLYFRDEADDGRLKPVTKMKCYVSNERSKGSIQARSGRVALYTGRNWPELIVVPSNQVMDETVPRDQEEN